MKLLVTSDFHGNTEHLHALEEVVRAQKPDIFVYAGDFSPARMWWPTPEDAIKYLEENFFNVIERLEVPYKVVIPGNTDYKLVCEHFGRIYQDPHRCLLVVNKSVRIKNVRLLCYTTTSYTDHCLKDFEAFDKFTADPVILAEKKKRNQIFSLPQKTPPSVLTTADDKITYDEAFFRIFKNFDSLPQMYKEQLALTNYERQERLFTGPNDYEFDVEDSGAPAHTILVSHSPPFDTCADFIMPGLHVGSPDTRKAIEHFKPDAAFSAHIHQSVYASGQYEDRIGSTRVFTVGNTGIDRGYDGAMYSLVYDTETGRSARLAQPVPGRFEFVCTHRRFYKHGDDRQDLSRLVH